MLSLVALLACAAPADDAQPPPSPPSIQQRTLPGESAPAGSTLQEAFPPPAGSRLADADPFGTYLRGLRVRAYSDPVRTHDGRTVGHHARVIDLPLVKGDLQQCADSALRLRAEFLRDSGAEVDFHATSGDAMPWARYAAGERAYAVGNHLEWKQGSPATWEQYLTALFTWAGTASLEAHDTVSDTHPDPGDVLVQGGFPGHAIVLLDVATQGDQTYVLVGEGFMPAQDFHVELGPHDGWWLWDDGVPLRHWPMPASALRRWKN